MLHTHVSRKPSSPACQAHIRLADGFRGPTLSAGWSEHDMLCITLIDKTSRPEEQDVSSGEQGPGPGRPRGRSGHTAESVRGVR